MKAITKYQSRDGFEFRTEEECAKYERLLDRVSEIMSAFPPRPENDGCRFSNGHGYIQLSRPIVERVRNALLDLAKEYIDHKWIDQSRDLEIHPSLVARILEGDDVRPIDRAWWRIQCIDGQWREWGQPFYANNPDKAESQTEIARAA